MSLQIRDDIRLAGQVIRYHTWPHIRQQSVGEHSWQVARILLSIAPVYPGLLKHAILHDIGEIGTGDLPYPVKANNDLLGKLMNDLEEETIENLCNRWGVQSGHELSEQERWIFKLAEFIEMWEWGMEEVIRGNNFAQLVVTRCYDKITDMMKPENVKDESVFILAGEYIFERKELWNVYSK